MHEDNESSIFLANADTKYSNKSKHIQWRYYHALQAIKEGTARSRHIPTEEQIADILTKYIDSPKQFYYLRSLIINCINYKYGV